MIGVTVSTDRNRRPWVPGRVQAGWLTTAPALVPLTWNPHSRCDAKTCLYRLTLGVAFSVIVFERCLIMIQFDMAYGIRRVVRPRQHHRQRLRIFLYLASWKFVWPQPLLSLTSAIGRNVDQSGLVVVINGKLDSPRSLYVPCVLITLHYRPQP